MNNLTKKRAQTANEKRCLFAYKQAQEIWKVQTTNYFQRVQILMVAIQAALFAGFSRLYFERAGAPRNLLAEIIISLVGIAISILWLLLIKKADDYLEIARRNLRNYESRLLSMGVPINYFLQESHVFGNRPFGKRNLRNVETDIQHGRGIVHYLETKEQYPDPGDDTGSTHRIHNVKGGMIKLDKAITIIALTVWLIIFIGAGFTLIGKVFGVYRIHR
jgi:hypothetical protein